MIWSSFCYGGINTATVTCLALAQSIYLSHPAHGCIDFMEHHAICHNHCWALASLIIDIQYYMVILYHTLMLDDERDHETVNQQRDDAIRSHRDPTNVR